MTHAKLIILNYLLNALWQVPLIYLVAALAARLTRSSGPRTGHRIWVTALFLAVTVPACAFAPALRSLFFSLFSGHDGHVTTQTTVLDGAAAPNPSHLATTLASIALIAFLALSLYFTARLLYRFSRTLSLRTTAQPITLTGESLAIWQRCVRLFDVHDAQLATSVALAGPSTIGIRRRIVLLPPTLLADLPHEDLAAALAHEFAHMRRRDFAKNLLYELIALPIAWHPLLWLTRLRIAETREMVCDEIAAEATLGTARYAHSLLRLAASFTRPTPAATLHAIGILDANVLERRVMTLNRKRTLAATSRRISIAAAVLLGAATCASAMSLRYEIPVEAIVPIHTAPSVHAIGAQQANDSQKVAAGVMAGQLVSKVQPVYPPEAKEKGIGGTVVLHAIIGKDGTIQDLAVISGPPVLVASAMDAVKQWIYKPYLLNGDPTEVETTITVNFNLNNSVGPGNRSNPAISDNSQARQAGASFRPIALASTSGSQQAGRGSDAGVNTVGGSVHAPVLISSVDPQYTEAARKAKLSGNVVVGLTVDPNGVPQDVHITKGLGNVLDAKAVEAVQQYRFKPGTKNGEPVAVALNVEVNFQIF